MLLLKMPAGYKIEDYKDLDKAFLEHVNQETFDG